MSSVAYTGFTLLMILVFALPMAFAIKHSSKSR
jgi:ABC-type spermidine/putrescine transport system permease subunit I